MAALNRSHGSKALLELVRIQLNVSTPSTDHAFPFEAGDLKFQLDEIIANNWYLSYAIGLIYVLSTFLFHKAMQSRVDPFELKYFAFVWNVCLATINAFGCCRLQPYAFRILNEFGLRVAVCTDRQFVIDPVCSTWLAIFPFVKIIELGDTFILVLQKRRLDPYYWCHHLFALLGSWYVYLWYPTFSVWLCLIVYGSHVPVYLYSCLRSVNVTLPKFVPFFLMVVEIATVFLGAVLCSLILYYESRGDKCDVPTFPIIVLMLVFVACFVLCNVLLCKKLRATARECSSVYKVKT